MPIKMDGFDELEKALKKMQDGAKELESQKEVPFDDLFTSMFMSKYTNFNSFDDLLEAGDFDVQSQEDFLNIPDDIFDEYISKNTRFSDWEDMLGKATEIYALKKLGF